MKKIITAKEARNIVINNSPPQNVTQDIYDKIEKAAKELQFSIQFVVGKNKLQAIHWQRELELVGYKVTLVTLELGDGTENYSLIIKW